MACSNKKSSLTKIYSVGIQVEAEVQEILISSGKIGGKLPTVTTGRKGVLLKNRTIAHVAKIDRIIRVVDV